VVEVSEGQLAEFSVVMPLLDERQRRVLADAGAKMLGRGGVSIVSRSAEMRHHRHHRLEGASTLPRCRSIACAEKAGAASA